MGHSEKGDNPMSEDHVKYDSQLIQKLADRLYAEADRAVVQSTVVATMVGVIAGYVIGAVPRVPTVGFVIVCAGGAGPRKSVHFQMASEAGALPDAHRAKSPLRRRVRFQAFERGGSAEHQSCRAGGGFLTRPGAAAP